MPQINPYISRPGASINPLSLIAGAKATGSSLDKLVGNIGNLGQGINDDRVNALLGSGDLDKASSRDALMRLQVAGRGNLSPAMEKSNSSFIQSLQSDEKLVQDEKIRNAAIDVKNEHMGNRINAELSRMDEKAVLDTKFAKQKHDQDMALAKLRNERTSGSSVAKLTATEKFDEKLQFGWDDAMKQSYANLKGKLRAVPIRSKNKDGKEGAVTHYVYTHPEVTGRFHNPEALENALIKQQNKNKPASNNKTRKIVDSRMVNNTPVEGTPNRPFLGFGDW